MSDSSLLEACSQASAILPGKAKVVEWESTGQSGPLTPASATPRARAKYRNVKTGSYASRKEAKRAAELKLMEQAGVIRDLREQVKYLLVPKQEGERACFYVADFVYVEITRKECLGERWKVAVEDCKGLRTPLYILKRKLMQMVHGIRIKET